jgi:hypothetical protein
MVHRKALAQRIRLEIEEAELLTFADFLERLEEAK